MAVNFHINVHDGPLDVLLALINKNEVSIYDIPVAEITDQFLAYIHSVEEIGLADLSEFYYWAAKLIYIKSKILLPSDSLSDFPDDYEDPRSELVEHLLEYSRLKKLSELLSGQNVDSAPVIQRKKAIFAVPYTDEEIFGNSTIDDIFKTFIRILKRKEISQKVFNVFEEVTEQDKTALLLELLETKDSIMFTDLFKKNNSLLDIICSFMAVLNCVKDKIISVRQNDAFEDFEIIKRALNFNPNFADDYDSDYEEMKKNQLEDEDNYGIITEGDTEENGNE